MSMDDVRALRTSEISDMARKGPVTYTRQMLRKAFTGEPSEYAYSEAAKRGMDIDTFMEQFEGGTRTAKRRPKRGFVPGKRREPGEHREDI